jgi:hypothetical protein
MTVDAFAKQVLFQLSYSPKKPLVMPPTGDLGIRM